MQIQPITTTTSPVQTTQRTSETAVPVAAAATTVHLLNPKPAIDPALGIVVTEYFNKTGDMTEQYPTAKMLDTYRIYGLPGADATQKADAAKAAPGSGTTTTYQKT